MPYINLSKNNENYEGLQESSTAPKLPRGVYNLGYNEATGEVVFQKQKVNYDKLVHLPNTEFDKVVNEIEHFLKLETRKIFDKYGFLYKRSLLLHGVPGTGKTCIVNRVMEQVEKNNGVILFNPHPILLKKAFKVLDELQPETKLMVIFEELDTLVQEHGESHFLSILDGEIQKDNVIYLATTNFIDRVPTRIYRPGRFSSVIKVGFPGEDARRFYLEYKLGKDDSDLPSWVEKTDGLSIDELKETVLAVKCLGQSLDDVVAKILALKKRVSDIQHAQSIVEEDPLSELNKALGFNLKRR